MLWPKSKLFIARCLELTGIFCEEIRTSGEGHNFYIYFNFLRLLILPYVEK